MIFYRSSVSADGSVGPSLKTLRVLVTFALVAYPAGALTLLLGPPGEGGLFIHEAAGLFLIAMSLFAAAPVLGSRLQRIVADEAKQLDEMELQLRHRSLASGYAIFTAIVLAAIFYAGLASDTGLWLPSGFDNWSCLFWGAFLYAALLPTAVLAWRLKEDPTD